MHRMLLAILAKLFNLKAHLDLFLILRRKIIYLLADRTFEFYKIILGHTIC